MVNEVNLHKSRQAKSRDYKNMAKMWLNARRGRLGMRVSLNEREDSGKPVASGRGWKTEERAKEGW
jgi:hypothetical protein